MSDQQMRYKYAANFDANAAGNFNDWTHHEISEREGRHVVAKCGETFVTEYYGFHVDEADLVDEKRCQRDGCFSE